jgi:hypothetical protein
VRIEGDKIYGPGVIDCKGGIVAGLMAMDALEQCGFRARPVQMLLQSDEETGSHGKAMDMMLEKGKYKDCCCDCRSDEVEIMQNSLNKKTVMVDWQYDVKEAPIESLLSLKDNGYDVIGASWLNVKNIDAHIKTVCENDMFGIMVTTWHTVRGEMYGITEAAKKFGATFFDWTDNSGLLELPATIFRKLSFEGNCYEQSGWLKNQVNMYWQ